MAGFFVFHPFEKPEIPLASEFANYMSLVAADVSLGLFGGNLWGLAITADVETETVDAYLWFDSEPSLLDRDEMGEFASRFDNATDGAVGLELHWQTAAQVDVGPIDRSLGWVHRRRSPAVTLPDEFDDRDLKY